MIIVCAMRIQLLVRMSLREAKPPTGKIRLHEKVVAQLSHFRAVSLELFGNITSLMFAQSAAVRYVNSYEQARFVNGLEDRPLLEYLRCCC